MVVIIFLRCRLFYIFALERNKVTNKARFVLHTPTDAVYISRVAAITSDCLFCYDAGIINTAPVSALGDGFSLDNRQRSSDNLLARSVFHILGI